MVLRVLRSLVHFPTLHYWECPPIHSGSNGIRQMCSMQDYSKLRFLHVSRSASLKKEMLAESGIPCATVVKRFLLHPCSQNMNLPPGLSSFHTSFITFLGSFTAHRTWMHNTVSKLPSVIPSSLRTSLSSTPQTISLYLSRRPCLSNFASIASLKWGLGSMP